MSKGFVFPQTPPVIWRKVIIIMVSPGFSGRSGKWLALLQPLQRKLFFFNSELPPVYTATGNFVQ